MTTHTVPAGARRIAGALLGMLKTAHMRAD